MAAPRHGDVSNASFPLTTREGAQGTSLAPEEMVEPSLSLNRRQFFTYFQLVQIETLEGLQLLRVKFVGCSLNCLQGYLLMTK